LNNISNLFLISNFYLQNEKTLMCQALSILKVEKNCKKKNGKTKVLIQTSFSLFLSLLTFRLLNSFSLFLILSASAFSLLSLSFSFSLLPPSHFFLSLSLSLLLRVHHGFSAFLSFFSNIFFCLSSSFDRAVFKSQKTDYGDVLYFFLSFVLFIFFCSSCFFCLQTSTESYKHMHLRFVVHLMFLLWRSFFFLLSQAKWYGSLCFLLRSNGILAWSYVSGV